MEEQTTMQEILEIVRFIKDNTLSKEEGATKEDLKQFATKEDLKQFATKEDLKNFATKKDMEEGFSSVNSQLESVRQDLAEVKSDLGRIDRRTKEDTDAIGRDFMRLKKQTGFADLAA